LSTAVSLTGKGNCNCVMCWTGLLRGARLQMGGRTAQWYQPTSRLYPVKVPLPTASRNRTLALCQVPVWHVPPIPLAPPVRLLPGSPLL